MTIIHVQEYLKTHSLFQLKTEHGIKSSAKPKDQFFSLNYDQAESTAGPMVNQCRGLILGVEQPLQDAQVTGQEPVGVTQVLARPFDRFFNLGDPKAAPVDMDDPSTVFFEKLDGTLCIVYFNTVLGEWQVATRAVPLADKPMSGWEDFTFKKLFESALNATLTHSGIMKSRTDGYSTMMAFSYWTSQLYKEHTYMFELTTPMNRIVVHYQDYRIHLLGARETATGDEFSPLNYLNIFYSTPTLFGVPVCPSHKLNNQEELLTFVGSKPPFEQEGVVVMDKHFNRVKVKSLAYMAYNRVRDSTANSPRAILELILAEKLDDVLPVLELHIQEKAKEMQEQTRALFARVEHDFLEIKEEAKGALNERKAFAIGVQERFGWMNPLMDMFLGKSNSFSDYVQKKRNPDGSYPDGFLDAIISELEYEQS